jgi:hypothetical protein
MTIIFVVLTGFSHAAGRWDAADGGTVTNQLRIEVALGFF